MTPGEKAMFAEEQMLLERGKSSPSLSTNKWVILVNKSNLWLDSYQSIHNIFNIYKVTLAFNTNLTNKIINIDLKKW